MREAPTCSFKTLFDSPLSNDFIELKSRAAEELAELSDILSSSTSSIIKENICEGFEVTLLLLDKVSKNLETLRAYLRCLNHININDSVTEVELNSLNHLTIQLNVQEKLFIKWVGRIDAKRLLERSPLAREHISFLAYASLLSEHILDEDVEEIISSLHHTCVSPIVKLQLRLISNYADQSLITTSSGKRIPLLAEMKHFHFHKDQKVRKAAHQKEAEILSGKISTFTTAFNVVKGYASVVSKRRGWNSLLEETLQRQGLNSSILNTFENACHSFFKPLRKYLKVKAKWNGQTHIGWYDILSPNNSVDSYLYSWEETEKIIVEGFTYYNAELGKFAQEVFEKGWLDALPRHGKSSGACCIHLPNFKESRLFVNFGGKLSDVLTIAHELGHAYHLKQFDLANLTSLQTAIPLYLSETSSTLCELIILNYLQDIKPPEESLEVLEKQLIMYVSLLMDMLMRFSFERRALDICWQRKVTSDELAEIVLTLQEAIYGQCLQKGSSHTMIWALQKENFSSTHHYLNLPYSLGFLLALNLHSLSRLEEETFWMNYKDFLRQTGLERVDNILISTFGLNVKSASFWESSLSTVEDAVAKYETLQGLAGSK